MTFSTSLTFLPFFLVIIAACSDSRTVRVARPVSRRNPTPYPFLLLSILAMSACTPRPNESSSVPSVDGGKCVQEQGVDVLEVQGVEGDAPMRITDPHTVQRILRTMTYSQRQPSGGKRRWTVRCYAGPKLVADVFVYPDGEWGYGSRTRGFSPALVVVLESLH